MGIWIGEKSSLEHLVHGWLNTWDQVAWCEGGLLDLGVVVFWIPVKSHLTNLYQWVVGVWPHLGDIKHIKSVVLSILLWHNLNVPGPRWEISLLNRFVKIGSGEVLILEGHGILLLSGEVLDSLIGLEMIFHQVNLSLLINPLEGMRAVAIHESVAIWSTSV